jgi:hypothetical protein
MIKSVSNALEMTQDMWLGAIENAWDKVASLQNKQDALLRQIFTDSINELSTEDIGHIHEIERLNREILSAAQEHREQLGQQLRSLHQGHNQAKAYRST